jgi:serine/threonine protein kinase
VRARAAVLQEVKALERLQHPNIVSYKHSWLERTKPADFGPDNIPTLFILTEYANAGNLHDFIFYNPNRYRFACLWRALKRSLIDLNRGMSSAFKRAGRGRSGPTLSREPLSTRWYTPRRGTH